jgi:PAS domain S-box-containing protein
MSDARPPVAQDERQRGRTWAESAWARYALAAAAAAAATLLMFALYALTGLQRGSVPFIFYFCAVVFAAVYGGRGPGLLTILLSALAAHYFFVPPFDQLNFTLSAGLQTGVFVLVSLFISGLAEGRARAEAAAVRSRESLRTTLRSIGDAVISTDEAARIVFMNPVAERLTGWTLADARGLPLPQVFRIFNEQTRETVESPAEKVLRDGLTVGLANHTVLLARDGREVAIDDSGAPIRDASGRVVGVVLVFNDITERRAAEAALRRRERELTDFIENATIGLHWVGADGTILWANRAELEMLGYEADEYVGRNIGEFHADRETIDDILTRLKCGEELDSYEARLRHKDGSIRYALISSNVLWNERDEFVHTRCFTRDITDRKRAEEETARLAAIVKSSHDAVIGKTLDGRITSWNEAAEKMYGYTAGEALGRHVSLLVPEERSAELEEMLSSLGRGESIEQFETERVAKSGARLDVSLTISPVRDAAGRLIGASTIARDISEQKRAGEESARLSLMVARERERLRSLVADVPGVVWEAWGEPDASSQRIDFVSDHVEKMLGYTVEEWLSTPNFWLTIVHPEDRARAAGEAHRMFESRVGGTSQFRWVCKDGRAVWVEAQSRVILDEAGRPAGMRGVTMDITSRRQAEERLRFVAEASRVLGSSLDYEATLERLARLSVAALADYCLIDLAEPDGSVRRVAVSHADPARQPLVERLREYPPDNRRAAGVPRVLRTGEPEVVPDVTDEVLASVARDDEHARLIRELGLKSFLTVPLVAREKTIGALTFASTLARRDYTAEDVAYAREIAASAALAIENARLYRRAQEVNRAKDEFLATLSHELRTPLTPILGWTHMIRTGRLGEAEVDKGVRVIEKNSQSLSRLINDLLDMSSILSGKMRIERAPVELASVVSEAVETVRPQADARRVALEARLGGSRASVSGDRTRLVQVFWNLLNNAVKFSPEGGRVRVSLGPDGDGGASVSVEDEGAGITPDFLPHVFERFRQADMGTTREHGGLGIGLALVKSFVEAHGGSVRAASAGDGRGSRFTVTLPTLGSSLEGRDSGALDAGGPAPCVEESCRVLLVEDAPDTLDMLRVVFESRGYGVTPCADAEEALRVAETGRFDIIVSDIGLPRIDGYELIGRLRGIEHMRGVPAVALTGYAATRDAEAALAAGFDAHVAKPVDPSALAGQVEQLVRRKA